MVLGIPTGVCKNKNPFIWMAPSHSFCLKAFSWGPCKENSFKDLFKNMFKLLSLQLFENRSEGKARSMEKIFENTAENRNNKIMSNMLFINNQGNDYCTPPQKDCTFASVDSIDRSENLIHENIKNNNYQEEEIPTEIRQSMEELHKVSNNITVSKNYTETPLATEISKFQPIMVTGQPSLEENEEINKEDLEKEKKIIHHAPTTDKTKDLFSIQHRQ